MPPCFQRERGRLGLAETHCAVLRLLQPGGLFVPGKIYYDIHYFYMFKEEEKYIC